MISTSGNTCSRPATLRRVWATSDKIRQRFNRQEQLHHRWPLKLQTLLSRGNRKWTVFGTSVTNFVVLFCYEVWIYSLFCLNAYCIWYFKYIPVLVKRYFSAFFVWNFLCSLVHQNLRLNDVPLLSWTLRKFSSGFSIREICPKWNAFAANGSRLSTRIVGIQTLRRTTSFTRLPASSAVRSSDWSSLKSRIRKNFQKKIPQFWLQPFEKEPKLVTSSHWVNIIYSHSCSFCHMKFIRVMLPLKFVWPHTDRPRKPCTYKGTILYQ